MITKEMAMKLSNTDTLHHVWVKNADGTPLRARPNGRCETWKTRPKNFRLPMKFGLNGHFHITPANAGDWEIA